MNYYVNNTLNHSTCQTDEKKAPWRFRFKAPLSKKAAKNCQRCVDELKVAS